jgi:hypothetical protein
VWFEQSADTGTPRRAGVLYHGVDEMARGVRGLVRLGRGFAALGADVKECERLVTTVNFRFARQSEAILIGADEASCARVHGAVLLQSLLSSALDPRADRRLGVAKKFVVVLPVALDFAHDALEFDISAEVVPVLVALKPGKIMISKLNRPSQPGEGWLLLSQ